MGWARAVTFLGGALVIAIVLAGTAVAQEDGGVDPGIDLLTTGYLADIQTPTYNMTVAWEYEPSTQMATVQPLVLDADERNLVLVATSNERNRTGSIVALDASDGSPVWETETGPVVGWTPGPRGTHVFASVEGEGLVAWDVSTGDERWNTPMTISSPPVSGADHLYVGAEDEIAALGSQTGEIVWTTEIEGGVASERPAVANGTVFSVADDPEAGTGAVHALDAGRGELLWTAEVDGLDERNRLQSPVPGNGLLYVAGYGERTLAALDPGDGRVLWEVVTRAPLPASPAAPGCALFLAATSGVITFLDASDGEEGVSLSYSEKNKGIVITKEVHHRPVLAGGTLYVVDEDGGLRVTDLTGVKRTLLHRLESPAVAPPTPHGKLLIQATGDRVTAFAGEPGAAGGQDLYNSCPDAHEEAREKASYFDAETRRTPEEEGELPEHGPGDDQPTAPPREQDVLQNVSGGPMPASAEDGSGGASRATPWVGLVHVALALGGLAAAGRRR